MAVVRARSSPPVALIATVIVAVASTALAVLFYVNWTKAIVEKDEATKRLDTIASVTDRQSIVPAFAPSPTEKTSMAVAQKQVNDLKMLISGDTKSTIDG